MSPIENLKNIRLPGYTLILPSVSVANVPQLTIDLLITTYDLKKLSTVWHPAIVSSVGGDPYQSNKSEICTACELYINEQLKLAAIQLRSAIEFKLALKFFNDLKETILSLGFKNVVILSSAFDYELQTINNDKFYYATNETTNAMDAHGIKRLEPNLNGNISINGAGFATKLYEILSQCIGCTLLVKYVSEGDNRPDALTTLGKVFTISGLQETSTGIVFPTSWDFVFGGPPPIGIY